MDNLTAIIGNYYGLDWGTLILGVTGSYLMSSGKLRTGFLFAAAACVCGLFVAIQLNQNGFIVYNIMLITLNLRGYIRGDRRAANRRAEDRRAPIIVANDATPEVALAHARAQ